MKWLRRITLFFLLLLTVGLCFEAVSTFVEEKNYPFPPGKRIDIGGYCLHIQTAGEGPITVVLDAGMTFPSLDWSLVQPKIASFTRVCSYDRAGLGWSDPSPYPRTAEQIVTELHTLLKKAKIPKPYLLVGHSMGGIHMRLFAARYPEEVVGLVLVDASHEAMLERLPPDPFLTNQSRYLSRFFSAFGLDRLLFRIPPVRELLTRMYKTFPESIQNTYLDLFFRRKNLLTQAAEELGSYESLKQIKQYPSNLKQLPLTVITAGSLTFFGESIGYSKEWIDLSYKSWKELQLELTFLSTQSKHLIAEQSDHLIPRHQPELIVEAVREMTEQILTSLPGAHEI